MDFLAIRKKAKERVAARGAAGSAPTPPSPSAPPSGARSDLPAPPAATGGSASRGEPSPVPLAPPQGEAPVVAEADLAEGALAARLQGPSTPGPRFTTWRPDSDAWPALPIRSTPALQPAPSDFAVYAPGEACSEATPASFVSLPESAALPAPAPTLPGPLADPLADFFYRPDEEAPALPALAGAADPPAASEEAQGGLEEFLSFRLGGEEYALPIQQVREVLKQPPITEVPRAPASIVGVVTVRGDVVAVFDPRGRLGLPAGAPPEGAGRIVIVDDGAGPCGLLVDGVSSVVRLARGSVETCPQGIGGAAAECLAGIGRERGRLFTVLDLQALLRRAGAAGSAGEGPSAGSARAGECLGR
jgi:purine-binding chemotaxis protein CheW